ncbi:MAG: hypothetical protein EBS30_09920 [Planctomycetes bacterium]|nr:hypothetical protein [Planctomycetota bacterium]
MAGPESPPLSNPKPPLVLVPPWQRKQVSTNTGRIFDSKKSVRSSVRPFLQAKAITNNANAQTACFICVPSAAYGCLTMPVPRFCGNTIVNHHNLRQV